MQRRAVNRTTALPGLARLDHFSIATDTRSDAQRTFCAEFSKRKEEIQRTKERGFRISLYIFENLVQSWTVWPEKINIYINRFCM